MSRPLIVGAAGQVGQQIARILIGANPVRTSRKATASGWRVVDLEALAVTSGDAVRLLDTESIGSVYCVGGATDVENCEAEPEKTYQINEKGPAVLAAAAQERGLPFVYFSTEYVFDGRSGPYSEQDAVNPLNVYGKSKLAGELLIMKIHPGALIIRTTVVYGQDDAQKNFLYGLVNRLSNGVQMKVAQDQISTPTYNKDLAQAAVTLLNSGASGIYHVCGLQCLSRFEFALEAARVMDLPCDLIIPSLTSALNQKATRPLNAGLATQKLRSEFPQVLIRPLEEGIRDFMAAHAVT